MYISWLMGIYIYNILIFCVCFDKLLFPNWKLPVLDYDLDNFLKKTQTTFTIMQQFSTRGFCSEITLPNSLQSKCA